jgi:tetratricopeptide (TPR) repeat protein
VTDDPTSRDEELTGATKREGASHRPGPEPVDTKLPRGTLIGRYVVLDVLGEGGMGVVYAAYDPELDRKLAIKLLQAKPSGGSTSHGDQAWLQREAQALARLAHPNVIAVHDVGMLPGDRVWVAMELVDGLTLRAWLKQPRTWREVSGVMSAAGAGLAAAHNAGLIHRDFKPENVLVGHDGRVRVMDFGLARLGGDEPTAASRTSDLQIETRSPLSESLTIAGSVIGTPAYMAPEIFDGEGASARSDQFAFGVTLYELLYLQRPYDKRAFTPPRAADIKPRDPPKSGVPALLQRIAMRAVAIDPAARFASMDALLADLAIDPMAQRKRLIYGGAALAVVGGAVIATMQLTGGSPIAPDQALLCKGAERHLAGVWDAPTKQAIQAAFDATSKPYKDTAFAAITTTLDRYTAQWTAAVTESCEATQLRGEQTAEVQSLRQDCFDQRLAVLRSFSGLLAKADDALVDKASNAALALEREETVARCADIAALKEPMQPSAEIKPRVLVAQAKLADAHAGIIAGNFGRAINAANEAVTLAKAIPFDPVLSEAHLVVGMATLQLGNQPDALVSLAAAAWAGMRGRRDDIASTAALYSTVALTQQADKREQAQLWLDLGKASLVRAASKNPTVELLALQTEGILRATSGDLTGAITSHRRSLARSLEVYGNDNPQVAQSHVLLGASLGATGDYAEALPHYQRALTLTIKWLGTDHPDVAIMHSGLGSCYHNTGDTKKARAEFARAIEIRERVFGKTSPILIPTLNNTAEMLLDEGEIEEAFALSGRAKQLLDKYLGKNHPYHPVVTATYGSVLVAKNRIADARVLLDDAVAVAERTKSSYLGGVLADRAKLARAENQWEKSAELDTRSIAAFEATAGKTTVDLWKPLTGLGLAKLHANKPDEARPHLERALAIATKARIPETTLRATREALARTQK